MPPTVFPVNSVKAMRGCIWLGKDMVPFARAVFEAYWGGDKDISKDAVLTEICKRVGIDPQKFFAGISEQAIKDQLKANTDEVMARGGFGSPTIFVDKTDMYFGNDRLPLIREALLRLKSEGRLMPKNRRLPRTRPAREPAAGNMLPRRRWSRARCASPSVPPGINFPDILMAAGEYQLKPPLPFTPGVEAAGDVVEVNGAARASRSATGSSSRCGTAPIATRPSSRRRS